MDWQKSNNRNYWHFDIWLGTFFDVVVHATNAYLLSEYLGLKETLLGIALVQLTTMMVLFNSKLAWSTPGKVPAWVAKRVRPVRDYST